MLKKLAIPVFVLAGFLTNSACQAGFVVKNNCDAKLEITWVMTFGPHIYSNVYTIKPGESCEITGGFNSNRTYWLSIRRTDNGQPIGLNHTFPVQNGTVWVRGANLHYFSTADFTNAFVASEMRAGNWNPLRNTTQTTDAISGIRITNNLSGESRGGELTVANGRVLMRAW